MNKAVVFFVLLCFSLPGYAQQDDTKHSRFGFAFSPGIIQQRNTFIESNLFIGTVFTEQGQKVPAVGVSGFLIGIESDLNKTIAPKIGYEFALLAITLRLSAANYYQDKNSEARLIPEFGFCIGGWVNLTYGYGFSLNDRNLSDIGRNRAALSFNLNRRLGKASYGLVRKK